MLLVGDSSWILRMQNGWKKKVAKYYANTNHDLGVSKEFLNKIKNNLNNLIKCNGKDW